MSKNLDRLCSLLIEDVYGEVFASAFSILTTCGRLSADAIQRKSRLSRRDTRRVLSGLVQLQLVYHHTTSRRQVFYEANHRGAYNLLRSGRFVQVVQERFGRDAAEVALQLLHLGNANLETLEIFVNSRPNDSQRHMSSTYPKTENDAADTHMHHIDVLHVVLQLISAGFIARLRPAHFHISSDIRSDAEAYVKTVHDNSMSKGKKSQEDFELKVQEEIEKRIDARIHLPSTTGAYDDAKRSAGISPSSPSAKRRKLSQESESNCSPILRNGTASDWSSLEGDVVLCANVQKLTTLLRNGRLAKHAEKRAGSQAGQIMAAVLQQFEDEPYRQSGISKQQEHADLSGNLGGRQMPIDIARLLLDVELRDGIHPKTRSSMTNGTCAEAERRGTITTLSNGYQNSRSAEKSYAAVESQLQNLAEMYSHFVDRDEAKNQWTVNLPRLTFRLRDDEMMRVSTARFPLTALRVLRILADVGKLDERTVQEIGLLSAKDLRQNLTKLQRNGLIDLQEVPREPQRQPSRTMYLWFYDSERVRKMMLEDIYKSLIKIFEVLKLQRQNVRSTLDKIERTGVKGSERKWLPQEEFKLLSQWRRREQWLFSEVDRLDETVILLGGI